MAKERENQGEAYAFFDCSASKREIEEEIIDIKRIIGTPNELELSLTEGINPESFNHPELREIAKDAKDAGIKYSLTGKYAGASNKKTADELASIINQAYQSPLYQDNEQFRGGIFYQDQERFVERE